MTDTERISDLERQLAEAKEQAERLDVALFEMENAALEYTDGSIRHGRSDLEWSWDELTKADPGILSAHDSRVRAETLRAAAENSDRRAYEWRTAAPPEERMAQICEDDAEWLRALAERAERGKWPGKGTSV